MAALDMNQAARDLRRLAMELSVDIEEYQRRYRNVIDTPCAINLARAKVLLNDVEAHLFVLSVHTSGE